MQTDISGNVLSVTGRQVGRNNNTIFDVVFSDGKTYSTFDDALANQARQLQGQPVTATVSVEQSKPNANGRTFTNYNLIALAAGVPSSTPTTGVVNNSIPIQTKGETDKERQESIVRQTCIKAAGHAFSAGHSAEEVLEIAEKFYRFVTGAKQPEQVAAGVAGGPDVPGDAIPWL